MSSSQEFTVYKTLPYNVYARAAGKWDYLQTGQVYNSSQTVNISMTDYDGLSMTADTQGASALSLDFSATVLPWKWDYYNYLLTSKYCFMPTGQWYDGVVISGVLNITNIGGVTIDDNYNATGFTTSKYLGTPDIIPSTFNTWEAITSFLTKATNYQCILNFKSTTGMKLYVESAKLKVNISSNGTSQNVANGVAGTTTIQTNRQYWVKCGYDGTTYTVKLSTTGAFAGEETTEISVTGAKNLGGNVVNFGVGTNGTTPDNPLNGTIYLSETSINIDGIVWWQAVGSGTAARQGCTYNYTDDGSAVTLNAFVVNNDEKIVLTPDNSYTNGYYLGTVNVPAHNLYTYSETQTAWTQPTLTANGTVGGDSFACACGNKYIASYDAWKAFDGSLTNLWRTAGTQVPMSDRWLEFYNPDALVVTNIKIRNGKGNNNYPIVDYEFQYSDDGTTWLVAVSGTNTELTAEAEWNFNVNAGAHKYWRIWAKKESAVGISEMTITAHTGTGTWTKITPFTQPALTANGTMGGNSFATEMDTHYDSTRLAYKAFDGVNVLDSNKSNSAHWQNGYPHWIAWYNPDPLLITKITIYNADDYFVPKTYKLQCSDDYSTWTDIVSGTNLVGGDGRDDREHSIWSFNVPNSGFHKYYRFYATEPLAPISYWNQFMSLTEIELTAFTASNS